MPPWVDDPYNFETPFYHSSEIFEYAMKALSKKLAAMGLDPAMLAEGARRLSASRARRDSRAARRGRPSTGARERILDGRPRGAEGRGLRRA